MTKELPIDSVILYVKRMGYAEDADDAEMELANIRRSLAELTASAELHANINRRTAAALGKPLSGDNSTWSDIPEQVVALRAENKVLREALDELSEWYESIINMPALNNETNRRPLYKAHAALLQKEQKP